MFRTFGALALAVTSLGLNYDGSARRAPTILNSAKQYERLISLGDGKHPFGLKAFTATRLSLCGESEIEGAPVGRYLFFSRPEGWRGTLAERTSNLVIVDSTCVKQKGTLENCGASFFAPDGLEPTSWTSSGVFLAVNGRVLAYVDLSSLGESKVRLSSMAPLNRVVGTTIISSGQSTSQTAAQESARLASLLKPADEWVKNGYIIRGMFTNGPERILLLEAPNSLQLVALVDGVPHFLGLEEPFLKNPALAVRNGRLYLYGDGLAIALSPNARAQAVDYRHAGLIDPETARPVHSRNLKPSDSTWQRLSAAVSKHVEADISEATDGRMRYRVWIDGKKVSLLCDPLETNGAAASAKIRYLQLGSTERPLPAMLLTQAGARGTAIVFPGGPADGVTRVRTHPLTWELLNNGWNVLDVNYSGTLPGGPAVSRRIAVDGPAAFEQDAETVADWVNRHIDGAILIAGESLGGIPASALSAAIHERSKLLLIAPYLRHREPGTWIENPVTAQYQRRFEAVTLGLTSRTKIAEFTDYMQNVYHSISPDSLVVIGTADKVSRPCDLSVIGHPVHYAIEPAEHRFITASSQTWLAFSKWLSGSQKRPSERISTLTNDCAVAK